MKHLILWAVMLAQLFSAQNFEKDNTPVVTLTHEEKDYLKNKKSIKMCVDPDWMPFEMIENGKHVGLAADYMQLISQKIDTPIILVKTDTWTEATQKGKSRECDIFSIISITPEREKYLNFTSPYMDVPIVIATASTELFIEDINQILDKKIGIAKGYSVGVLLKQKYPNMNIVEVESGNDGLRRVEKGEIFCYIDNLASIVYEIQKNFIGRVHISGRLDTRIPYRAATRNDEPILNEIFEKAVLSIDATTKQQILSKWTKVENVTEVDYILMGELAAIILLIIIGILHRQHVLKREHTKLQSAYYKIRIAKSKIKNQKKIYELIFDNSADGILVLDNGKFTDCNDSIVKMLKYDKKEDILNLHPSQLSPKRQPDGRLSFEKAEEMIALAHKNHSHRFEWMHTRATGEDFWAEIMLTPIVIDDKEILYVMWRDISERKKLEFENAELNRMQKEKIQTAIEALRHKDEMMFRQSRLAQVGEMISMIAHQWRQPLAAISSTSALLELKAEHNKLDNDLIIKKVRNISNYSQHLSETINDFRNFFKPNKEKKETTYDEVVKSVLEIIGVSITHKNIQLLQELNCHETFSTYPSELKQVILNLIKNAEDALLEKGVKDPYIKIATYTKEDKYILEVSDNAGGAQEGIMDKIFDPYFSTKETKDGTGLGLYMSKTIIEEHCSGKLSVKNGSDGAVFTIQIPTETEGL